MRVVSPLLLIALFTFFIGCDSNSSLEDEQAKQTECTGDDCESNCSAADCSDSDDSDDDSGDDGQDDSGQNSDGQASAYARNGDFQLGLNYQGALTDGKWLSEGGPAAFLFRGGLWFAGYQEGSLKATLNALGRTNYESDCPTGEDYCVYFLDSATDTTNWPQGAPRDSNGEALVYGDQMAWSQYKMSPYNESARPGLFDVPFDDVAVSIAVFMDHALDQVVFARYEVTNNGQDITDAYLGLQTDMDLEGRSTTGDLCMDAFNSTGFDLSEHVSYTYSKNYAGCNPAVAGTAFLESPVASSGKDAMGFHTIYRKNQNVDYDFSEVTTTDPQSVYNFLQGLSYDGQAMVDSTTGQVTRFAFDGDPVTGTGWVDTVVDVRALSSAGPFDLATGETTVLTVAFVIRSDDDLGGAISGMTSVVSDLRAHPGVWQY